MATNLSQMMCLDIFINSLSSENYQKIKPDLTQVNDTIRELMCADLYLQYFDSLLHKADKNRDITTLNQMAQRFSWQNNVDTILKENVFETLVITDNAKKILWVNDGFSKMTGYSKKFAIDKTPDFLQGKNSLQKTKNSIRKKLDKKHPFKEVIINYRKDNSAYKCELYIFPLYNKNNTITHYLALEKQIA